jgi:hypothetical protein
MYCDPERLSALQRVFDAVWLAARVRNKPEFLSHPDKLRDDIAYCVMSCAKLDMKHDDILLAGLELLELRGRLWLFVAEPFGCLERAGVGRGFDLGS